MGKIMVSILMLLSILNAKEEWKFLPEIGNHPNIIYSSYKSEDYHIRNDIDYFELRRFLFKDGKQLSKRYKPFHVIAKKALLSYGRNKRRSFKKVPFVDKNESYIKQEIYLSNYFHESQYYFRINGFLIKDDGVIWKINEKRDLLWVFDGIDTEAELATFLWLYDDDYIVTCNYRYREVKSGYVVEKSVRTYPYTDSKTDISYMDYSTYRLDIKRDGIFTKRLILFESKALPNRLMIPSPHDGYGMETAESILSDDTFISP